MSRRLTAAELRFINLVAARRFTGSEPGDAGFEDPPAEAGDEGAFARAASVASAVLERKSEVVAPRATALLSMCSQLALDGFELLAPQGATAGMVNGLAAGEVSAAAFAHWLEDRAVPMGPPR